MTTRSTSTAVTTRTDVALPGLMPNPQAEQIMQSFTITELDGDRFIDRIPSSDERKIMQQRLVDLHKTLRPISTTMTDCDAAARALAAMFMAFPSVKSDTAAERISAYVLYLHDLPLFAIQQACDDIARHRIKDIDPDFPPSTARLHEIADKHRNKMHGEKISYDRVVTTKKLLPPPITEGHAKKMQTLFADLGKELREKNERETTEETERRLRTMNEVARRSVVRSYELHGEQPVVSDGILISRELQQIERDRAARLAEEPGRDQYADESR